MVKRECSPRKIPAVLRMAGFLLLLGPLLAAAGQRVVVSGWVEPAASPFDECDYVMRRDHGDFVQYALTDPLKRIFGDVPDYQRLTVELTTTWFSVGGQSIPKLLIQQVHPPATLAFKGLPCGVDPARFAACDNGLYPSIDEPLSRNLRVYSSGGTTGPDSDGDGVPDSQDAFPNDPNETEDTDGDKIGNNADPDDDNDTMPDTYERENGLNSLVDDADGDLDRDGQTNASEAVAGSAANDASSYFRIEAVTRPIAGNLEMRWNALPGRAYSIFFSPDLSSKPVRVAEGITVTRTGFTQERVAAQPTRGFYFLHAKWLSAP